MTTKQVQKGWQFKGVNVISKDYTRIHFFPADVGGSRSQRGWSEHEERIEDVEALVTIWRSDQELPKQFEVVQIVRLHGKVVETNILKAEPYYEQVEEEEENA